VEVMEVELDEHGTENREDYDDFVRDDENGALDFCWRCLGSVSNPD